jgi:hypothetical protein
LSIVAHVLHPVNGCRAGARNRHDAGATTQGRSARERTRVAGDQWLIVLVRAWFDGEQLTVRLLRADADGATEAAYASSPVEAARRLVEWLDGLGGQGVRRPPHADPVRDADQT